MSTQIKIISTTHKVGKPTLQGLYIYKTVDQKLYYIKYISPNYNGCFNLDSHEICNCYYKNICVDADSSYTSNSIFFINTVGNLYTVNICGNNDHLIIDITNICKSCCGCKEYISTPTPTPTINPFCYYLNKNENLLGVDTCDLDVGFYYYGLNGIPNLYSNISNLELIDGQCICINPITQGVTAGCSGNTFISNEATIIIYKDNNGDIYEVTQRTGIKRTNTVVGCTGLTGCDGVNDDGLYYFFSILRLLYPLYCNGKAVTMQLNECITLNYEIFNNPIHFINCGINSRFLYKEGCVFYNVEVCNPTKCNVCKPESGIT